MMIDERMTKCILYNELSEEDRISFFDLRQRKFLHSIDTFYYSVSFGNDFSEETTELCVKELRKFWRRFKQLSFDQFEPVTDFGLEVQLNYRPFTFSRFYCRCLECPGRFDIFIADKVPNPDTAPVIVQLRSEYLWSAGYRKAFEETAAVVEAIARHFGLSILEYKENRVDYCWHTNYLQDPETYFRIDNFNAMKVTSFRRVRFEYAFKAGREYENDYIAMGKRSDKMFLRIYLKSKEVVQQQYKCFFLVYWLSAGLINRYDFFVYDKLVQDGHWQKLDFYRLQFYLEYGTDEFYLERCRNLVNREYLNLDAIHALAEELTPRVTLVLNVEFQTMRAASKSFVLKEQAKNKNRGPARRIYDYFGSIPFITEYLTHSVLRLVDRKTDSNISRCDYNAFWRSLRQAKMVDVQKLSADYRLVRDYSRKTSLAIIKARTANSLITASLYKKGLNEDDVEKDMLDVMDMFNDNDMQRMRNYKLKKSKELNFEDFEGGIFDDD